MARPLFLTTLVLLVVIIVPFSGCGGAKKKGGSLTIGQQLEKAKSEKDGQKKAVALMKIARGQSKAGDKSGAANTARVAFESLPKEGDAGVLAPRFVEIAGFLASIGEKTKAKEALGHAEKMVDGIPDKVRQADVLADIGGIFADRSGGLGDQKAAAAILERAEKVAEEVEERFRGQALAAVALGYTKGGLKDRAAAMVEKLEASGKGLEDARAKAETLAVAATVRFQTGTAEAAKALLEEASKEAEAVQSSESRTYALLAVARAMVDVDDKPAAKKMLDKAYAAANKVGDPTQREQALAKVATAMDGLK